jgi:anaerobic dimethyl sulfoxide reductase subunit B (iron-sulfur subunit)
MTQYGFFFDQSRCYGCQACSVACKDWNDIAPGPEKWMSVYEWETGTFPNVRINLLAFSCGHCAEPRCMSACEQGAISKEDTYGAVIVDTDKCQGDRKCFSACPYGTPRFADDEPGTKMSKCTMCIDRLEAGDKPICVLSCPMRAFDFGPLEELTAKYGELRQLSEMPDASLTTPSYIFKPHRERQTFVRLDAAKTVELQKQRGDLGTLFECTEDLTAPAPGIVKRNALKMKNATAQEVLAHTRNDLG